MRAAGSVVLIVVVGGCAFDPAGTLVPDGGSGGGGEPCALGETRACGTCLDGVQACVLVDEFADWGPCEGASATCTAVSGPDEEPTEIGEPGDPFTPPEEPAVPGEPPPQAPDPPEPDPPPSEPLDPSEVCRNGIDDDGDWDTDCEDVDCAEECAECFHECVAGTTRWCNSPSGCHWGQQVCNPDQTWGACHEVMAAPAGCEAFVKYDTACCDGLAGACCEDWPFLGSVGECTGTVPCFDWP